MTSTSQKNSVANLIWINVVFCLVGILVAWVAFRWSSALKYETKTVDALKEDLRKAKIWNHSDDLEMAKSWTLAATAASLPVGLIRESNARGSLLKTSKGLQIKLSAQTDGEMHEYLATTSSPGENFLLSVGILQREGTKNAYPCLLASAEYALCLSENRYSFCHREKSGNWGLLIDWTPTSAIYPSTTSFNQLALLAEGSHLKFFINDKQVNEIINPDFAPEGLGVALFFQRAEFFQSAEDATFIFNQFNLRIKPKNKMANGV